MSRSAFIAVGIISTAMLLALPACADVGGLAPFVGTWAAHEEGLVIQPNGSGHLDYEDLTSCPSCSMADAPRGTVDFTLSSVSEGVATGIVDASSDAANAAVGAPVTATIVAVTGGHGQMLQLSSGKAQNWNFCNDTSVGQCGS